MTLSMLSVVLRTERETERQKARKFCRLNFASEARKSISLPLMSLGS